MLRKTLLVLAIASALAACGKGDKDAKDAGKPGASASAQAAGDKKDEKLVTLTVAPEDIIAVNSASVASGPVITGSIMPERRADLRAEVSAIVMQVMKENGDVVKKGDVLLKLDETSIRDALASAEEAARASSQALDQSTRTLERLKTLRASGMTSVQALDDAEVRRNNAQSDLAAARSRAAAARQQLARTTVRAPFDGIVSDRKVSAGDTASIGKELVKVIDPNSMRFEGRISADKVGEIKQGQHVTFRVNGYGEQAFNGIVKRVDPSANDVTRQVEVLVAFAPGSAQPKVAGLYAEGSIDAASKTALMLPENAMVKAGDTAYTWKIKDKKLAKTNLQLGSRDARTGLYEVKGGLMAGDVVLRTPSSTFRDGQNVEMKAAAVASASDATKPAQGK
jgi:RND family efflux transporter MFP subunit